MKYGDLKDRVVRNVGNRDDPTTLAIIQGHTNNILQQMIIIHEWEDLRRVVTKPLVVGQAVYSLSNDFGIEDLYKPYSVILNDTVRWLPPMTIYPYYQWERDVLPVQGFVNARPGSCTFYGGDTLEFSCPPSFPYNVKIHYFKKPALVTQDVQEIELTGIDLLLEALITGYTHLSLQNTMEAGTWFNLAKPLADTYVKEAKQVLNFNAVTRRNVPVVGVPWLDPFVSRGQ